MALQRNLRGHMVRLPKPSITSVHILIIDRNFVGLLLCIFCYRDPSRLTSEYTAKDVLRQVDYIGGFLSTAGVTLFMMGLQWGATQVHP